MVGRTKPWRVLDMLRQRAGWLLPLLLAAILVVTRASGPAYAAAPSPSADRIAATIAKWEFLSRSQKRSTFLQLLDSLFVESEKMLADGSDSPSLLYNIQIRWQLLVDYANERDDVAVWKKIAHLAKAAFNRLTSTKMYRRFEGGASYLLPPGDGYAPVPLPDTIQIWTDATDKEIILSSSQFIWMIANILRRASDRHAESWPGALLRLRAFASVIEGHYRRWVLSALRPFQVAGWGCDDRLYNHEEFLRAKKALQFANATWSYCHAITDTDLWILAGVAEILLADANDVAIYSLGDADRQSYAQYLQIGLALVRERLAATQLQMEGGAIGMGYDLDPGAWRDHPDYRYAGYLGDLFPEDNGVPRLADPDFEDPQLSGWILEGKWSAVADRVWNGRGAASVRLDAPGEACLRTVATELPAGRFIAFSHIAGDSQWTARLVVDARGAEGELPAQQKTVEVEFQGPANDWRRIELTGVLPWPAARVELALCFAGQGTVWVDAVRLVMTDIASPHPWEVVPPRVGTGSWDISHARRFVQVFRSLVDYAQQSGIDGFDESVIAGLARQVAYAVFDGNLAEPGFHNFFDGSDGWYRVNYQNRIGFGYAPGQLGAEFIESGYCLWQKYVKRLQDLCDRLWDLLRKRGAEWSLQMSCYTRYFVPQRCDDLRDRVLAMLVSHPRLAAEIAP
ncbi:MAG: hypothetical protein KatS3mg082_2507 [Nitrospiraceae bacterium]|nr:MAG: hypothetical protein KatS3mg082_2507 [Nitrospiraceae bacterium]